ncbi:MAG: pyruvate, phosphate dikinase [Phycisphaerales bacterium]
MAKKQARKKAPARKATSKKVSRKVSKKTAKKTSARSSKQRVTKKKAPASRSPKMVHVFSASRTDGDGSLKMELGGKGANLAEMTRIGLPVPPGLTIGTSVCAKYSQTGELPRGLMKAVREGLRHVERQMGETFGDPEQPLLLSVRSGAPVSMPGMMDTILNLGLNDRSVEGIAQATGDRRFAFDVYRRFVGMFGDVVMGVPFAKFERVLERQREYHGVQADHEIPAEGMEALLAKYKHVYLDGTGEEFPQEPWDQLERAIEAVFKSWDSPRAKTYRRISGITGLPGTAVNVQAMVYGNTGPDSGTGVAFTRNPSTGENAFYGEFLVNAQGEDVVAGIRTPRPASEMKKWNRKVYAQLQEIKQTLESHFLDMQDIEFTVEHGKLWMLQNRSGKRTAQAALRIACDMEREGLIDRDEALMRIPANDLSQLLLPSFDPTKRSLARVLATGLPASPGAATGKLAFSADEAVERSRNGERVLLVRKETSPEDVDGMHSAVGILTSTGGMTSHAAVVARGWGKCCVVGAGDLRIDGEEGVLRVGDRVYTRDDVISIDGSTGDVLHGAVPTVEPELSGHFAKVMRWSDQRARMQVRANADTPEDARRARDFGAVGIGLCRTEHMFFDGSRIRAMREMIIADSVERREMALAKLLPFQREDFVGIFRAMDKLPVTVRLLDPPLHEFLPQDTESIADLAESMGEHPRTIRQRVAMLHEANPMMGHRGCRLAITYPEILRMQVRAITEAAIECLEDGGKPRPEIMIPLVGVSRELKILRDECERVIEQVKEERGWRKALPILIGTMIEIPRAALVAQRISPNADFFSFGTNDLTQLTFGYSRDDVNSFLPDFLEQGVLPHDPFQQIDTWGVGELVRLGVQRGRSRNPGLKCGICGEHGGDPKSVAFCETVGLDYVSCSPFRVPIARVAAAQAKILAERA